MRKENLLLKPAFEYAKTLQQQKKFCVYFLFCPLDKSVKYVGMTNNIILRFKRHLYAKENKAKWDWIDSLLKQNKFPELAIMDEFNNVKDAADFEKQAIGFHRNNIINGKTGATYPVKRKLKKK